MLSLIRKKLSRFGNLQEIDPTSRNTPIYVFSLHKSGTHLLENVLNQLGLSTYDCYDQPNLAAWEKAPANSYIATVHRIPSSDVRIACAKGHAKIILNVRDPRDIFLSTIDYFDWTRKPSAFDHINFYREAYSNAFRNRTELAESILNDFTLGDYPYTISNQLNTCLVLHHHPSVLTVRYEDLHSYSSASADLNSAHPVYQICHYLSLQLPSSANLVIGDSIMKGSRTMNRGVPGRWKTDLEPHLLQAFENKHHTAIRLLGYDI